MFRTITPPEAKAALDREPGKIVLLDVRSREEFAEKHIPGAMVIPYAENRNFIPEVVRAIPDRNATVYVYCRSGRRSRMAAETLSDLGYVNVYQLGGIEDWPFGLSRA